ncbi:spermidine synthase [Patescibacteria group bacterium]
MMPKSKTFYYLTAFIGGMTIMAIEMSAVRVISPYFGSSIFVWTNILGIIMIALATGYFFGGRVADKAPHPKVFFTIVLFGAIAVMTLPFVAQPLLENLSEFMHLSTTSLILCSLAANMLLFFIPFALLGMISPYLIRLSTHKVEKTGNVSGTIFAISTLGSITGTFLPTLLTVPLFGVKRTIILFGAILCVIAAIGMAKKSLYIAVALFAFLTVLSSPYMINHGQIIAQTESPYSYVAIREDSEHTRYLSFNQTAAVQSMQKPDSIFTGGHYWDYMALLPNVACADKCDVAIIGSAGSTIARQIDFVYPNAVIDGVEIDPKVTELASQYFDYDLDSLTMHHADGRIFLAKQSKNYDLIILDAFDDIEMPPHLTSWEFAKIVKTRLAPNGVFAVNIISTTDTNDPYLRYLSTLGRHFTQISEINLPQFSNRIILATNRDGDLIKSIKNSQLPVAELEQVFAYWQNNIVDRSDIDAQLITDDMPLTEILADQMIFEGR